ncbi:MAG: formylglycine-generating enzyme family protein [Fimbriimonadales bacterium]
MSLDSFVETVPGTLVSFKMVRIPDGEITINGQTYEIKNLAVGETEVTWDLYDIWAHRLDQTQEEILADPDATSRPTKPYGAADKGFGHSGFAALGISYHSCQEFCFWLEATTGKNFRMPFEYEWEYAARAGATEAPAILDEVAWYWDNSFDAAQRTKTKKPNEWGLYDMLGNIAEWACDEEGRIMVCGGSFKDKAPNVSYSARERPTPAWNQKDPQLPKSRWWFSDGDFVGFRLVCEVER